MTSAIEDQLERLRRDCARLEQLLDTDPQFAQWRSLQGRAAGADDVMAAARSAAVSAALSANPLFIARRSLMNAIAALEPLVENAVAAVAGPQPEAATASPRAVPSSQARLPRALLAGRALGQDGSAEPSRPLVTIHTKVPGVAANQPRPPSGRTDDLTRIRRIDRALADQLVARGIRSYDQIAAFSAADVRSLSAALALGVRVSRENWIEQAAVLALRRVGPRGRIPVTPAMPRLPVTPTLHTPVQVPAARPVTRPDQGDAASAAATPETTEEHPALSCSPVPAGARHVRDAAAGILSRLSRASTTAPVPQPQAPQPRSPQPKAPQPSRRVLVARAGQMPTAPGTSPPVPQPAAGKEAARPTAAAAPTQVAQVAPHVSRVVVGRAAQAPRVAPVGLDLGRPPAAREAASPQSRLAAEAPGATAAREGTPAVASSFDAATALEQSPRSDRVVVPAADAPRTESVVMPVGGEVGATIDAPNHAAPRQNAGSAAPAAAVDSAPVTDPGLAPTAAPPSTPVSTPVPTPVPPPDPVPPPVPVPIPVPVPNPAEVGAAADACTDIDIDLSVLPAPDDLQQIRGIDAALAAALERVGVVNWAEIADWRHDDVRVATEILGPSARIHRDGWIEQAAVLATGRLTRFAALRQAGFVAALTPRPHQDPQSDAPFAALLRAQSASLARTADRAAHPVADAAERPAPVAELPPPLPPVAAPIAVMAEASSAAPGRAGSHAPPPLAPRPPPAIAHAQASIAELITEIRNQVAPAAIGQLPMAEVPGSATPPPAPSTSPVAKAAYSGTQGADSDTVAVNGPEANGPEANGAEVDAGFDDEADVLIVARSDDPRPKRPDLQGSDTVASRGFGSDYAAYRERVEEASVEIVALEGQDVGRIVHRGEIAAETDPRTPVGRFLKALKGS